ncbi:UDP-N-acetylglucosamine transporter [Helicoverpa armigera]|uniref:UDP-N-acetylglucosamine transporter n=1 Tax=Helicoverpa armigera TaxID=29058 RepID=UPI000B3A3191|nr:UDP-N-acetylglucosamine transporter isoform X2 [Helicoverpa armigera]XP_021184581.1 UDP-N-acetylglucosamine transporter isoform X2 [Helicoverpa armigera]XP_049696734.1 UDP-N-acetylglucosamine transporter isoform X2 [Helicoverpa armigera]
MDGDSKKAQSYAHNRRVNNYGYIKYVSLVILTLQNAALGLSMRYARTRDVEMFSSAAAVLMAEVFKLVICVCLVMQESGGVEKGAHSMYSVVILNVRDTLRVCVPSFLYIVQNNLLYVSASNLDAATYQVTYQLKILTTAFFAVLVLKRQLKKWQWFALAILAAGVALVQLSSTEKTNVAKPHLPEQSKILGFSAALAACFISGFAGIYFEKVLKESDISVWMRNVQLSLLSLPFGTITYLVNEGTQNNLLKGFDGFVWYLVILQAAGGLIVAVVVKYADNILKGFATSVAIIISCIASIYIFDFNLTVQFAVGTLFVIVSIFLYGYVPKKPEPRTSLNV